MSKTKSSRPVLPGQSRSAACPNGKGACHRLAGHKGACRGTLNRAQSASPTGPTIVLSRTVSAEGRKWLIEVWSDGSTKSSEIVEERQYSAKPKTTAKPKARARAAKGTRQLRCRIVRNGQRCSRAYGHKQAGTRHSFAVAAVKVLPEVGPKGRDQQVIRGKSSRRGNYVASGKPSSRLA